MEARKADAALVSRRFRVILHPSSFILRRRCTAFSSPTSTSPPSARASSMRSSPSCRGTAAPRGSALHPRRSLRILGRRRRPGRAVQRVDCRRARRGWPRGGVAVRLMQGNRDVLLGEGFAAALRRASSSPTRRSSTSTERGRSLMHGDTLCTDDVEYQKFRAYAHDPGNQRRFLAQPLPERRRQMLGMREQSEQAKGQKTAEIMDVAPAAVESVLRAYGYPAPDTRPHAPPGPPRARRRRPRLRALGARRLVRARRLPALRSGRLRRGRTVNARPVIPSITIRTDGFCCCGAQLPPC